MNEVKENDILETTLSIVENGYAEAYQFLLDAYEARPDSFGPQTLYFSLMPRGRRGKTDRCPALAEDGNHGARVVVPPGGAGG